ncbi:purine nucleosidase [Paenibacillus castaneae]|uniref:nucleoside hydrolase n=1 Tax=Paenibacillus castaneae TaxID=474957 RepID=UPI000C9ADC02|nr:nucleoside hydrolase [Paenibacillus castaneae]NIK76521.1 purine nucleosidase [Paenibacillus castaneae]
MNELKKIVMDCDTGIDDSLAIIYALKTPGVKVEGISTVFGNASVEQATENTLRIVKLANAGYDVPVVEGAAKPLIGEWSGPVSHVHGDNGIGNVDLPASDQLPLNETAADFIIRKANELDGELILVTTGRLTNLALALQKDAELPRKIKRVVIMGGTVHAPGNVTPVCEANFRGDPEAVSMVFASGLNITMVGLDVTMKTRLTQNHLDMLDRYCSEASRHVVDYIQNALQYYFQFYQSVDNFIGMCPLHDPLTIMVAVDPSLVRMQTVHASIETEGELCAGMVVADFRTKPSEGKEISVCMEVDSERAVNKLVSAFL